MKPSESEINRVFQEVAKGWVVPTNFFTAQSTDYIVRRIIEEWESIRPSDSAQMARTNQELGLDLAQTKTELKAARAALPEWIPNTIGNRPTEADGDEDGEILRLNNRGQVYTCKWGSSYPANYPWMRLSTLANLPKRPEPPKPTPEELERAEFEKAMRAAGYQVSVTSSGVYYGDTSDHFAGWQAATKAARKGGEG